MQIRSLNNETVKKKKLKYFSIFFNDFHPDNFFSYSEKYDDHKGIKYLRSKVSTICLLFKMTDLCNNKQNSKKYPMRGLTFKTHNFIKTEPSQRHSFTIGED